MGVFNGFVIWISLLPITMGGRFSSGNCFPERYSETFGSGTSVFGIGGYHPIYSRGYVYECKRPNGTIYRCPKKNTLRTKPGGYRRSELHAAIVRQRGYMSYDRGIVYINNVTTPLIWEGRTYFWNRTHYNEDDAENKTMCIFDVHKDDNTFKNLKFMVTLDRPRELIWGCPVTEYCCNYECCEPKNVDLTILVVANVLLIAALVWRKYTDKRKQREANQMELGDLNVPEPQTEPPAFSSPSLVQTSPQGSNDPPSVFCQTTDLPIEFLEDQPPRHPSPIPSDSCPPSEFSTTSRTSLL